MTGTAYPLQLDLRIDWSEIDAFGHINNLAILRYAQSARACGLERVGMMPPDKTTGLGPILASTSGQFRKQLHYPGMVRVRSRFEHLRTTSFHMAHQILDEAGDVVAEVHDVMVFFDFHRNEKHPIPEALRERLAALGPDGQA